MESGVINRSTTGLDLQSFIGVFKEFGADLFNKDCFHFHPL